jgi:uncharacterized protein YxjI
VTDLTTPFQGTLLLPDKILPGESPVTLANGEVVAKIKRPYFPIRHSFDILDVDGSAVGYGGATGFFRRRWPVRGHDEAVLLELTVSWTGTSGRSTITLHTGQTLEMKGRWWTSREYSLWDGERQVAAISPTAPALSMRADSYAFTLNEPVLSIIQAVGLAQSIRAEVQASRSASSSTTSHHHNP